MPVVLRLGPYAFLFFSNERQEPFIFMKRGPKARHITAWAEGQRPGHITAWAEGQRPGHITAWAEGPGSGIKATQALKARHKGATTPLGSWSERERHRVQGVRRECPVQ